MAEGSGDSLLERMRIIAVRQQVEIMIAFENQRVTARKAPLDAARRRAKIGQHAQSPRAIGDDELHGLARVMRHRERMDLERADGEHVMAVETEHMVHLGEVSGDGHQRAECRPHRNAMTGRESGHTADVIGMLVGDENRRQRIGHEAKTRKPHRRVANAKAAVDHDAGAAASQAIAFAAAAGGRSASS